MNSYEWFQGRRCAVTGASGYIGSRLVQMLGESGAFVGANTDADVVFHLGGQTSASVADADSLEDLTANVEPMVGLIEEYRRRHLKPFIVFAGAATQVGVPGATLIDEKIPDAPLTVYDLHKCMAEMALEHACRRGWARGCTLRLANVYGPSPTESGPTRGVLNRMILRGTRGGTVQVYGSGEWYRDYVYIDDVCRAFMLAAANQDNTNGRHFLIGSGDGLAIRDVAKLAANGRVEHAEPPEPLSLLDRRSAVMNTAAFPNATGWEPLVRIAEGIELTRAHYTRAA